MTETTDKPGMLALRALAAVVLCVIGARMVVASPWGGALLFAMGGLLLAWPVPNGLGGFWASKPQPFSAWEPVFLTLFLGVAGWARFYQLGDIPMGATGAEGEVAGRTLNLMREPYIAHVADGDINWPTLVFFQGRLLADWLGWEPASFRLASVFWGVLSLPAFYIAARAVSSPMPAAGAAMLYGGLNLHLVYSRQFFPSGPLMIVLALTLGLYVQARRSERAWLYAAAGASLGLALHGYTPGRVLPGVFAIWFLWQWAFHRQQLPGWRSLAWFWGSFFVVVSPVLWWAVHNPQQYWGLVTHHNVFGGKGVMGYINGFIETVRPYVRMWHIQGDVSHTEGIPLKPVLDPVSAVLVPLGFFYCVALFWRPLPTLLIGALVAGLLPAMMGGGFAHPTTRRTILAYAPAFLMVALALEQLRRALLPSGRWVAAALAVAVLGAGAWSLQNSVQEYFGRHMQDPLIQLNYGKKFYLLAQQTKTRPKAVVIGGQTVLASVANTIFMAPQRQIRSANTQDDMLALLPGKEHVIAFDPFLEGALPWYLGQLPGSEVWLHSDERGAESFLSDPFNPKTLLFGLNVPAETTARLHSMIGRDERIDIFDSSFGERWKGRQIDVRGVLLVPQPGGALDFACAWPGWTVQVEGQDLVVGTNRPLPQGMARIRVGGVVPVDAKGPLPLSLKLPGRDLVAERRLLGISTDQGLMATYAPGRDPKTAPVMRRWEPFPIRRYYDITELPAPFTGRWSMRMSPPATGSYGFGVDRLQAKIFVNGSLVFERAAHQGLTRGQDVRLVAGQSAMVRAEFVLDGGGIERTMALRVRQPGQAESGWADPVWFSPVRE